MSTESRQVLQFQSEVYRRLDEMDRRQESSFNRLCERLERKLDASLKMQEQMSNTQRKFCDEHELRLGEVRNSMCSRLESLNKTQKSFQKQLSAHGIQTFQMQKDLKSLDLKEEFSRQVSAERQKLISHQLFQVVEVLNVLNYNVKFGTDKCDQFQEATAEQIQNDISQPIQDLEKRVCGLENQVKELAKGSSFQNPAGMPSSKGQHFTSASVDQGNLFLGDVTVQGHVIGQVDVRKVFEGKKTQKTEIKNINHYIINQLKEKTSSRNIKVMSQGTMTEQPVSKSPMSPEAMAELRNLKRNTGPVARPLLDEGMTKETIVVLGGWASEGLVESFNTDTNTWTAHKEISDGPSKQTLAVTVGDVILIIIEVVNKRTRSLDFASRRWTELESPPVYRNGMRAAADGNLLYLTGGWDHWTRCDVYDFHSNQWSEGPKLNVGRRYHGSATLAGKVYCCGGWDGKVIWMASTEVFDPKKMEGKGRWTSVADMTVRRDGLGLASCSRFLWAVGGWRGTSPLTVLERYEPVSDNWTRMANMRVGRNHPSVCFFSGKLYTIGGSRMLDEYLTTVEAYDPERKEWIDVAPLNKGRGYQASCVVQLPSDDSFFNLHIS